MQTRGNSRALASQKLQSTEEKKKEREREKREHRCWFNSPTSGKKRERRKQTVVAGTGCSKIVPCL